MNAPALLFCTLSLMTSLWPCLRSTTLACPQWARPPLPLVPSSPLPPPTPPRLVFFFFLTHMHSKGKEKNDLSAAHNSLHFYRPEWSCSTKGDIIFSGFDWPPPCHRMTSCKTAPPPSSVGSKLSDRLLLLDAGLPQQQEQGPELGSDLELGSFRNRLWQLFLCVFLFLCGKQ